MKVPFFDLVEQHQSLRGEIKTAVGRVLDSQYFVLGKNVDALEKAIATETGTKFAVGLASGSDALYLALWAAGVGPGDEVITTPFTFFATAGAISRLGARPVFADIDPRTFNLDPSRISSRITSRTKAIVPVHLFGLCADMDAIRGLAKKHGLVVIEDAAQAFGATIDGHSAGSLGKMGCFSFYPTKNLGGGGDGGMLVTSSAAWAEKVRLMRDHGSRVKYRHEFVGINSRLDELQAAILLVKLKYIGQWNAKRKKIAARYSRALKGLPLETPYVPEGYGHVFHLYSVLTEKREALSRFLAKEGIGSAVYYPLPLHLQPCYRKLGYRAGDLPVSEKTSKKILALPLFPELSKAGRNRVITALRAFFKK
ncbi:MAG: DegT/DnrJ/EryC1/StrS family aminotransferase [Candidatus Omnitrophica bacterium]|nr:DegT/DnrJ/EryC1/StrS family aminotransferase [Candidatus Omnitrophota bacterium]